MKYKTFLLITVIFLNGCAGVRTIGKQPKKSFSTAELQTIWKQETSSLKDENYVFPLGIREEKTEEILGKPNLVRNEKTSLMTVHNSHLCTLYSFFEQKNQDSRLKHLEVRDYKNNSKISALECFKKISASSTY